MKKGAEWIRGEIVKEAFKKQLWPKGKAPGNETILDSYKNPYWDMGNGNASVTGKYRVARRTDASGARRKERDPATLYIVNGKSYAEGSGVEEFGRALLKDQPVQIKITWVGLTLSGA